MKKLNGKCLDTHELRIGNFILNSDKAIAKITGFCPYGHSVRCDEEEGCMILMDLLRQDGSIDCGYENELSEFEPIKLTKDWLLKLGFLQRETKSWFYNEFFVIEQLFNQKQYSVRFRINDKESIEIAKIDYVHELQNIQFDLKRKELAIVK